MKGSESIQEQSCCRRRRCDRRCGKSSSQIWTSPALGSVSDAQKVAWNLRIRQAKVSRPACLPLTARQDFGFSQGEFIFQPSHGLQYLVPSHDKLKQIGSQEELQYCQRVEWQQLRMLPQSSWLMPWLAHPRHPSCAWSTTLICSCL